MLILLLYKLSLYNLSRWVVFLFIFFYLRRESRHFSTFVCLDEHPIAPWVVIAINHFLDSATRKFIEELISVSVSIPFSDILIPLIGPHFLLNKLLLSDQRLYFIPTHWLKSIWALNTFSRITGRERIANELHSFIDFRRRPHKTFARGFIEWEVFWFKEWIGLVWIIFIDQFATIAAYLRALAFCKFIFRRNI